MSRDNFLQMKGKIGMTENNGVKNVEVETLNKEGERTMNEKWLDISVIKKREVFRIREKEDEANIERLRIAYLENKNAEKRGERPIHQIPLIVVWYDPRTSEYVLVGGYHRLEAAIRAGLTKIRVLVFHGTEAEAFQVALDDNNTHGVRLSRGDLRYTIEKMLQRDPEQGIRAIARALKCAASYVSTIYNRLRQEELSKGTGEDKVQKDMAKPNGRGKKSVDKRKKQNALAFLDQLIDKCDESECNVLLTEVQVRLERCNNRLEQLAQELQPPKDVVE
jgi:hypothetical protein